jgi:hypothetical protein
MKRQRKSHSAFSITTQVFRREVWTRLFLVGCLRLGRNEILSLWHAHLPICNNWCLKNIICLWLPSALYCSPSLLCDTQNTSGMKCFSGLFIVWHHKKTTRRGVLLMGLSDAGKTLIYTRLLHNKFVDTHTSVKENSGGYDCGKVRNIIIFNNYLLYLFSFFPCLLCINIKVRIYKTLILPAVLYGCETWSLTLREGLDWGCLRTGCW